MRNTLRFCLAAGLTLLVALAACSNDPDPAGPPHPVVGAEKDGGCPTDALINHYRVTYDGRTFDGEETAFRWTVSGTGVEPALSWFFVELPDCAPEPSRADPSEGFRSYVDPVYGVSGVKWIQSVDPYDTQGRQFTLVFPGEVAEGVVRSIVAVGNAEGIGDVYGPCGGYEIGGTVFTDADSDGSRAEYESGIPDVVVEIVDAGGGVCTTRTDNEGSWRFLRSAGAYTVRIDTGGHPDSFNATLAETFTPTTSLDREVVVGPDATGIDFGFVPATDRIIERLEQDVILADGEPVRWWRKQVHAALRMLGGDPQEPNPNRPIKFYDPERILEFIAAIQQTALPDPYVFTPGSELQEAYEILRRHPRTDIDELYRELLASEFNEVSGRGFYGVDPHLQDVLIAWGEALIAEYRSAAPAKSGSDKSGPDKADTRVIDAIKIFNVLNTGGGGGIDE